MGCIKISEFQFNQIEELNDVQMPSPESFSQCLEVIEKYLESHLERLQNEYKIQRGELPPQNEFSQLTETIESVKSLGSIQEIIYQYRAELGE